MTTVKLGQTLWVEIPLTAQSGTPDAVEAIVVNPTGSQTAQVCTLLNGYYGVLVTFYLAGRWFVLPRAYVDADPLYSYDADELLYIVPESNSSNPFQRA